MDNLFELAVYHNFKAGKQSFSISANQAKEILPELRKNALLISQSYASNFPFILLSLKLLN